MPQGFYHNYNKVRVVTNNTNVNFSSMLSDYTPLLLHCKHVWNNLLIHTHSSFLFLFLPENDILVHVYSETFQLYEIKNIYLLYFKFDE